ncbi:unnamed protein product [Lota lota]
MIQRTGTITGHQADFKHVSLPRQATVPGSTMAHVIHQDSAHTTKTQTDPPGLTGVIPGKVEITCNPCRTKLLTNYRMLRGVMTQGA